MKKIGQIALIPALALGVTACSDDADAPEAGAVTETQMDDVDVIDGTISDDMVDVDAQASGDELADGEEAAEGNDGQEEGAETSEESE